MSAPFTPLFINGQERPASTGETFEVRNPYSSDPNAIVGTAASASSQDCKDAIAAAAAAFPTWEATPGAVKRGIFLRAADLLASEKYERKALEATVEETAAVMMWRKGTWMMTVEMLRSVSGLVNELKGETFPSGSVPGGQVIVQRRAKGVMFASSPWNAPLGLSIRAVAIPIICGNPVVLKASEYSPRGQAVVAELFHEAGLPAGVLNFVTISRENAPQLTSEIIAHPAVRHINFTGSPRVGRILAAEAGKHLKPCVLELGGKAPAVVLEDANITEAARAITSGALFHSGQICMSTERVIVQRGVYDALLSAVSSLCKNLKAGDPETDPGTQLSALFSQGSADNAVGMVKAAKEGGAEVVVGDIERAGAVVQPHVITGAKPGMRIWDEETFAPVIAFAVVDTIDEAVELANASDYSLAASLWTNDLNTALLIAPRINSGYTNINGTTFHAEMLISHAGLGGASGYGRFDVDAFTDKRAIVIHPPGQHYPLVG